MAGPDDGDDPTAGEMDSRQAEMQRRLEGRWRRNRGRPVRAPTDAGASQESWIEELHDAARQRGAPGPAVPDDPAACAERLVAAATALERLGRGAQADPQWWSDDVRRWLATAASELERLLGGAPPAP
jgi:hypothetical protein